MEGNRWKFKITSIVNEHHKFFEISKSQNFLNFADQIGSNKRIIQTMLQVKYLGYSGKQYPFPVQGSLHMAQWWVLDFATMTWSLLRINIVNSDLFHHEWWAMVLIFWTRGPCSNIKCSQKSIWSQYYASK